jgi:hypothetical protein
MDSIFHTSPPTWFQIKQFDTLFGVNGNGNGIYLSKFSLATPRYTL